MKLLESKNSLAIDEYKARRVREFCEEMRISNSTFWKFVGLGKIRVIRIGGRVLIPAAEVMRISNEGVSQ